jgi:predicted MFS family arabinose efflux permease
LYLALSPAEVRPDWLLLALLAAAGMCWIAGAAIFLTVNEYEGATDGGRGLIDIARDQIRLILGDQELQRFILARALMTATALSGPIYVALAQRGGGQALDNLGWLLLASGFAGALSGSFWGMLADRSSRATMAIGAAIGGLVGLSVLALVMLAPAYAEGVAPHAAALFVLNIGHAGVRIGRKTQIVDIAGGDAKAEYVAVSNTVIGVLLIGIGATVGAVSTSSLEAALLLLAVMALAGAAVSMRLENAQA